MAEFETFMFMTSAPNLFPASSKELNVRVELSKKDLFVFFHSIT